MFNLMLSLKVCEYFMIVTEEKDLFFFKWENALSQFFKNKVLDIHSWHADYFTVLVLF